MSFSFGAQPTGSSPFGQTPAFGAKQPFGAVAPQTAASTTAPQFGSTFGVPASTTGLQFGSSTATPSLFGQPQTGSVSFGLTTANPATSFGMSNPTPSSFGTPGLFGAAASAPSTGLTFGTTTSAAPSFGTGLSFGAPATSAQAFGTPQTTAPSFGLGSAFNTPASVQSPNLTFGTSTMAPSSGLGFGTPASTALTFGSTPVAPTTGIAFGNTASSSAPSTGLTFSMPTTTTSMFGTPASTGLNFGSTPASSTGLTLGVATPFNPASTTNSTGLTLGAVSSTPNLSLGTGTTLNFGTTSAPSATTGAFTLTTQTTAPASVTTNNTLTLGTATSTPATSLPFGGPSIASSLTFGAKPVGPKFSLGGTTSSSTSTPLTFNTGFTTSSTTANTTTTNMFSGLGLPSTTPATSTSFFGLGGTPTTKTGTTTTTASQVGLGGIVTTAAKQTITSTSQNELPPKDQPLPNEILQTVESFKMFLKEQKANSSEIARFSIKELKNVEANIVTVNNTLNELENELHKNKCMAEKLKLDSVQALQYAEMAQWTFDTPANMQYDNSAPIKFFAQLLQNFERDLQQLRFHLEYVSKQVKNENVTTALAPEDLALGLRRLHRTFVTLAGRLQIVHNQVEVQKDRYLNLRKLVLNDTSNVFESQNKELEALEHALNSISKETKLPEVVAGPSPFNSLGTGQAQLLAQNPPPVYPGTPPLGQTSLGGANNTSLGLNSQLLFGTGLGNTSSIFNSPTSNSFQLQKPPTGSKRGKT